ncbi:NtaA/DmoA family FMN-dependent monooxygenase [Rhodococcus sp. (in: high G+C Gram-positive bacteria)]|uniref:NtaA/DmoA family FMN-dependent monooxygenase n=1 Tax=Rhodococcus sp. TaxID=1831 RepID=UPI003890D09E
MSRNTIRKHIHLGAHFPGVNNTTVWADPASKSQIDFASFLHLARTAERGKFDFFFLAEGLRLREHRGRIHDLDVVGRPDTLTVLEALAGATTHLGLAGTINTTFNEPYELAKQFATLDHLSGGRAAWNLVTSSDAFTGENFRRGGYLDHSQRYVRAHEVVEAVRTLWDSWSDRAPVIDRASGVFASDEAIIPVDLHTTQFDITGRFEVPRSPQGHPVLLQAGDSDEGREFGAARADAIFSRHGTLEEGRAFYTDVKSRLAKYGRTHDDLKILPAATFVLGDSPEDAQERARHIRLQQVGPQTALAFLEQIWGKDLSSYDPDGPLPDVEPEDNVTITRGRVRHAKDPLAVARAWKAKADAENLSIRELVIETTARQQFVGTPQQVADEIDLYVQTDASDGFILVPHLTPGGLDDFVDQVVPLLQERGSFRADYETTTLRGHLGVADPHTVTEGVRAS